MRNHLIRSTAAVFIAAMIVSSGGKHGNQLTAEEKKEGWVMLFDGRSMTGNWSVVPISGWSMETW